MSTLHEGFHKALTTIVSKSDIPGCQQWGGPQTRALVIDPTRSRFNALIPIIKVVHFPERLKT